MAQSSSMTAKFFAKDVNFSRTAKSMGGSLDGVGRKAAGLGSAFAGIGTAAVVAGGMVALDFGKQSVDAFIDAQTQAAKFDDAFSRFPELKKYKGQIDDLAQSLALKTKYDDDATKAAAATLAKFGLTGKQLKTLIPLTQDYASATGKDLGSSATAIGKAVLGNTKALKGLGIAYKPTGDKAKDLAAITDLLSKKVGGFAEKEGKTAAGTAAILSNQFGEVKETIGSYLVPALTTLGRWIIETVIPAIAKLVEWFKVNLLPVIQRVAAWVSGTFVPAMQDLARSFMENVWPAIVQVAGMMKENLAPAIDALANLWRETLQPAIEEAMPAIQATIGAIALFVAGWLVFQSKVIGVVIPAIASLISKVVAINTTVQGVVVGVRDKFAGMVEFVRGLPQKIAVAAAGMWDGITAGFRAMVDGIRSLWNNSIGGFSFHIPGIPGTDVGNYDVSIPKLAKGGIVTRPTLALIGEAGPEAVVPLGRGGTGSGMQVVIQVNGDTDPAGAARRIGKLLEDAIDGGTWRPQRLATRG